MYGDAQTVQQPVGSAVISKFCCIDGYWYYFASDGGRVYGLQWVDEAWHIFDSTGRMCFSGTYVFDGIAYEPLGGDGKFVPVGYDQY